MFIADCGSISTH